MRRLNIYRTVKGIPTTERYVNNVNTVGGRRVKAGLRMGCLPLAVETSHYSSTTYQQRVCRMCDQVEVEDQVHFTCICPVSQDLSTVTQCMPGGTTQAAQAMA